MLTFLELWQSTVGHMVGLDLIMLRVGMILLWLFKISFFNFINKIADQNVGCEFSRLRNHVWVTHLFPCRTGQAAWNVRGSRLPYLSKLFQKIALPLTLNRFQKFPEFFSRKPLIVFENFQWKRAWMHCKLRVKKNSCTTLFNIW